MFHPGFGGEAKRVVAALGRSMAVAEFALDGRVLSANENFARALGYEPGELSGKNHSLFASAAAGSREREFWARLARGETDVGEYRRVGKTGRTVWLNGSYSPLRGRSGAVVKALFVGCDVTAGKALALENERKLEALSRAQAIAEFAPDGTVLAANQRFLDALGYRLEDIVGRPHGQFLDPAIAKSEAYAESWRKLNRGEPIAEQVRRVGKTGAKIWFEAIYNPVLDADGKVTKVLKLANDVTGRVDAVNQIAAGLSRLAEGDLGQRIETAFIPALEKLRVDFNASTEALERSMVAIGANMQAIRSGAGDIASTADDLSRRTEQQASSLDETAAAIEQITATVNKTAEGARHARDVVSAAKVDADKSGDVVREAMSAMSGIDKSSKQISQIIGVIDEIAFQTNLLALNAGVEAARAGEAGRGFAVVASEVRALAQRSAEAAKEIKSLISTSTAQVDQGVLLVTQTGVALERIVGQVVEINRIIADIASSAQDQATGLAQVNDAVGEMDRVTKKNAAMVGETTTASHALNDECDELGRLVARFRVRASTREASPAAGKPSSPARETPTPPLAEDRLRRELKKAAPHAFREAPPAEAPRTAAKAAAAGADDGWREF